MKKIALMVAITSALAGCALDNERQTMNGTVVPTLDEQEQAAMAAEQGATAEPMAVEQLNEPIPPLNPVDIAITDEVVPLDQEIAPVDAPAATEEKSVAVTTEPVSMTGSVAATPQANEPQTAKVSYEYVAEPVSGFTVQVLGVSKNSGFASYIAKLPGQQPVWVNQKTFHEKPWYTLLYGHFDTVQEAQAAIKDLPAEIRSFGPFVRSLARIHQSPEPKLTKIN